MNGSKLIQFVDESEVGEQWLDFYKHSIKSYKKWFLKEGEFSRPNYQACHNAIKKYMPELEGFWLDLIDKTNANDLEAITSVSNHFDFKIRVSDKLIS